MTILGIPLLNQTSEKPKRGVPTIYEIILKQHGGYRHVKNPHN